MRPKRASQTDYADYSQLVRLPTRDTAKTRRRAKPSALCASLSSVSVGRDTRPITPRPSEPNIRPGSIRRARPRSSRSGELDANYSPPLSAECSAAGFARPQAESICLANDRPSVHGNADSVFALA